MASKLTETINVEATVAGWLEKMGWTFKSSEELKVLHSIQVGHI